jgi:hypothetical protein
VVVPNGTLFGDGISAVIKEEMLKEFRLHTIVRLPQGVFAPYTDIPANLLFFERGGPTDTIWYYELPLPEGRKKYSKTAPLQFEEFAPCPRLVERPRRRPAGLEGGLRRQARCRHRGRHTALAACRKPNAMPRIAPWASPSANWNSRSRQRERRQGRAARRSCAS